MKLKTKLFWVVFAGVVCSAIGLNFVLTFLGAIFNDGYAPNELNAIAVKIQNESRSGSADMRETLMAASSRYPGIVFDWFDLQGNLVHTTDDDVASYSTADLLARIANPPVDQSNRSITYKLAVNGTEGYLALTAQPGWVQSQFALLYFRDVDRFLLFVLATLLFLFTPAAVTVLYFMSVNRRIGKLYRAMQSTGLTGTSQPLDDRSNDEIGQLTRLFNDMGGKIQTQFIRIQQVEETRRRLVANLSHNLRTPLTSVIGYADMLNRELHRNTAEMRQWIAIIWSRAAYMERLLKQLFQLALSDRDPATIKKQTCDFSELVRSVIADYVLIMEDRSLKTDFRIPADELLLPLDREQIEQAVRNLLDNALAYGATGGFIGVYLESDDRFVRLSVVDQGSGIPLEEQARIFERMPRRTNGGGMGLGLAIVAETAAAHGGGVRLESVPNVETKVVVELPYRDAESVESASG